MYLPMWLNTLGQHVNMIQITIIYNFFGSFKLAEVNVRIFLLLYDILS